MKAPAMERVLEALLEKRNILSEWLNSTPAKKKEALLGPSTEQAVHSHLGVIDEAIASAESGTLGRCEVCHGTVETELLEIDYTACVCIEHLSAEEIRHLEAELELAQSMQKMLLPQEVPNTPGLEIAAFSRPAQIVGGDYFDFIEFRNGCQGLAIADVAGHGVSASLHMASIQALLRALVPVSNSPADLIKRVHELFIHSIRFTTFVTVFIAAFDPSTITITYCNAGHNPPLVLRKSNQGRGSRFWLRPTGAAIGLTEEATFEESTMDLHEGDVLVMYTDGITEAVNRQNEEFGQERLASLVAQGHRMPAKEMVQEIRQGLEQFSDGRPLADDATIVVCKIHQQT